MACREGEQADGATPVRAVGIPMMPLRCCAPVTEPSSGFMHAARHHEAVRQSGSLSAPVMRHATNLVDLVAGHVQGDVVSFLRGFTDPARDREAQPHVRPCLVLDHAFAIRAPEADVELRDSVAFFCRQRAQASSLGIVLGDTFSVAARAGQVDLRICVAPGRPHFLMRPTV
jgi:hypothetical protein